MTISRDLLTTLGLLLIALVAIWGGFLSRPAITVSSNPNPGLSVSGVGQVSLVPDVAKFTAGVVAQAKTVTEAQKKVNETSDKIKKALFALRVDKKDIRTINYSINPLYDYKGEIPRIRGYEARHELGITVRQLAEVDQVIQAVVEAGANTVSGISFTVDNEEKFLAEAREEAIKEARSKAENLARLAGAKLGTVTSISEYLSGPFPPEFAFGEGKGGGPFPSTEPGSIELELTVNINYDLK